MYWLSMRMINDCLSLFPGFNLQFAFTVIHVSGRLEKNLFVDLLILCIIVNANARSKRGRPGTEAIMIVSFLVQPFLCDWLICETSCYHTNMMSFHSPRLFPSFHHTYHRLLVACHYNSSIVTNQVKDGLGNPLSYWSDSKSLPDKQSAIYCTMCKKWGTTCNKSWGGAWEVEPN